MLFCNYTKKRNVGAVDVAHALLRLEIIEFLMWYIALYSCYNYGLAALQVRLLRGVVINSLISLIRYFCGANNVYALVVCCRCFGH